MHGVTKSRGLQAGTITSKPLTIKAHSHYTPKPETSTTAPTEPWHYPLIQSKSGPMKYIQIAIRWVKIEWRNCACPFRTHQDTRAQVRDHRGIR